MAELTFKVGDRVVAHNDPRTGRITAARPGIATGRTMYSVIFPGKGTDKGNPARGFYYAEELTAAPDKKEN